MLNQTLELGSHKNPLKLSIIASLQPTTSVVTIAQPEALASINDFGNPSLYDGKQTIEL